MAIAPDIIKYIQFKPHTGALVNILAPFILRMIFICWPTWYSWTSTSKSISYPCIPKPLIASKWAVWYAWEGQRCNFGCDCDWWPRMGNGWGSLRLVWGSARPALGSGILVPPSLGLTGVRPRAMSMTREMIADVFHHQGNIKNQQYCCSQLRVSSSKNLVKGKVCCRKWKCVSPARVWRNARRWVRDERCCKGNRRRRSLARRRPPGWSQPALPGFTLIIIFILTVKHHHLSAQQSALGWVIDTWFGLPESWS